MVETKPKSTEPQKKKSFYEVFFKSREFMIDVYLRFDCFIYLILGGFGFYNPSGMVGLLNYTKSDFGLFNNTDIDNINNSNSDNNNNLEEQYSSYQENVNNNIDGDFQFGGGDSPTEINNNNSEFIPLYQNPILIGVVSMYALMVSLVAIFQCLISLMALIQKEKSTKSILINLSLTLNFFLILFNTYILSFKSDIFTQFAYMGLMVSYIISLLDFSALFFLTSKHKSVLSVISSVFSVFLSCLKFRPKLPKLPKLNNNNNNKSKKK
ncbi:hypothetical protein RB653_003574 [Dictyostelium firmibasis]|uniref:Uncharacterized protein n=1 Tax=Dictyostelium firmibasis TaxID=79012 RepID=A0AAN7U4T5_9MYCE